MLAVSVSIPNLVHCSNPTYNYYSQVSHFQSPII